MAIAGEPTDPLSLPKKTNKKEAAVKPLNAVIYTRVSTSRQAEYGNSLEDQEKVCRKYCRNSGFKVLSLFVEPGVTGRTDKRPAFQKMITFCKRNAHKLAFVVVYDTSRIFRDTMQYLFYKKVLQQAGIELLSPNSPRGNSPVHRLTDTTQAAFAQFESDLKSVRAKESRYEVRMRGKLTNKAPIGYINVRDTNRPRGTNVVLDPVRAPIIAEAFRKAATGEHSIVSIYQWAVSQGLTSRKTGKPLTRSTFYRMFENPSYAGLVEVESGDFVVAEFPGIVSRELFEDVLDRLRQDTSSRVPHTRETDGFPLKGVLMCEGCDRVLTASFQRGHSGKRYGYYHHPRHKPGCPQKDLFIPARKADFSVLALLARVRNERERIRSIRNTLTQQQDEIREALHEEHSRLESLKKKQEEIKTALREKYVLGDLDKPDYEEGKLRVDEILADLRFRLRNLGEADIPVLQIYTKCTRVLEHFEEVWKVASDGEKLMITKAIFPSGLRMGKGGGVGTPSSADQIDLFTVLEWGEIALASPTGFEPDDLFRWLKAVASLYEM